MSLNEQQQRAVDLINEGKNVYLTGPAGTGKSYTIKTIVKESNDKGKIVHLTASTGIAASLIGGSTLHSWAGIGLGNRKFVNNSARERILDCKLLIIDEISMLDYQYVSKVDLMVRKIKRNDNIFGGIQLLLTGDFGQLPPVQKNRETPFYLFQDELWNRMELNVVNLTQIYRQRDKEFVELLMRLRGNELTDEDIELIQSTKNNNLGDNQIKPTILYCRNRDVDRMNMMELAKLDGESIVCKAEDFFKNKELEKSITFNLPEELALKVGAQVMLLFNDEQDLVNGSRGIVDSIKNSNTITVRFYNGRVKDYTQYKQEFTDEHGKIVAYRKQFPFRLAWCLTIHKSQGMTIDLLDVDLYGAFAYAQAYVAISRGVGLDNIRIRNFDRKSVLVSKVVRKFHNEMVPK